MKKILSIILSMTLIFASSITTFAADFAQDQLPQNIGVTVIKQELERQTPAYTGSETYEIEMGEGADDGQHQVRDAATANVSLKVMVVGSEVFAEVFLSSYDGVLFTKVEGTARLYVNGGYVTSEDFEADPLLPVASLQAGTVLGTDGLEKGDRITVWFDGSYDTQSHGSRDIYGSASATAT